jgi:hypothetical protein
MLQTDESWKTKLVLKSVAIGALAGLGTGYLMIRTAEENRGGPPEIKTSDAVRMAVNVIGLVRGIASMGDPR